MTNLDNPIWAALATRHRHFALGGERVRRYPADCGPFVAVAEPGIEARRELEELVAPGESVDFVGVAPGLPPGWTLLEHAHILQMICERPCAGARPDESRWVELTDADRPAMLELTALVYPAYFRERTNTMGRYIGIWQDTAGVRQETSTAERSLAAMAGERMATDTHVEISAVCTHPRFLGRGYAGHLVSVVANDILARGCTPFLHVSDQNLRAIAVYERLGFTTRARIPLWLVRRGP